MGPSEKVTDSTGKEGDILRRISQITNAFKWWGNVKYALIETLSLTEICISNLISYFSIIVALNNVFHKTNRNLENSGNSGNLINH